MEEYGKVLKAWNITYPEIKHYQAESITETDTRCKIIDPPLLNVLMWDESLIRREPKVESGYMIIFVKANTIVYLTKILKQ
ncbi:hypothetical protein V6C27_09440 [Peptococcaceae bacterium 1198_IL3148]